MAEQKRMDIRIRFLAYTKSKHSISELCTSSVQLQKTRLNTEHSHYIKQLVKNLNVTEATYSS